VPLDAGPGFKNYLWNTTERQQKITAYNLGTYWVRANYCSYTYTDTIHITQKTTGCQTVVPVSLLDFQARLQTNRTVLLQWQTATETNSSHFMVERSTDGISFQSIGRIDAMGNSNSIQSYSFTDMLAGIPAQTRTLYYRLQPVDKNGNSTRSAVKQITIPSQQVLFSIYPNPATTSFTVYSNTAHAVLTIHDMLGHTILTKQINGTGNHVIHTAMLARGMYTVSIHTDGAVVTEKMLLK
jgi:hypothetical protein